MLYRHVCLSNGEIYGMSNQSFRRFCQSCNIPDQILTAKELGIHLLLNPSQLTVKIQYSYQVHSLSARIKTTVTISNCRLFVLISYAGSKSKPDNRQLVFTSFLCSVMKMAMRKYYSKDSQPSHRYQCCLVIACWCVIKDDATFEKQYIAPGITSAHWGLHAAVWSQQRLLKSTSYCNSYLHLQSSF